MTAPSLIDPTLSYACGTTDVPLLHETIGGRLRSTVARFPDREALVDRDHGYRATWSELWDEVDRAARGLLAHGVEKGDRVGIWAPNRYEWVITQYATARIGAILVNVNPAYKARELEYALQRAGVSTLVLSRGFRQRTTSRCSPRCAKPVPSYGRRSCSRTTGRRCSPPARR